MRRRPPGTPGSGSRTAPRAPTRARATAAGPPLWAGLDERAGDPAPAVIERGGRGRRVSFGLLQRRVHELAAGLAAAGVRAGDRVALLVPPGADLAAAVYACWRAGAVIVVADPGLGPRGLARALRGAGPDHVIGVPRGLLLARDARRARAAHRRRTGHPGDPAAARRGPRAGRARPDRPRSTSRRPNPPRTPSARSCSPRGRPGRRRAWSTGTTRSGPSWRCCATPSG